MLVSTPPGLLGWNAPDFDLTDTFGVHNTLEKVRGPNGLLLMFICNHCPYVKAMGIGVAAIMSNDTHAYPEDSFANMQALANKLKLPFPYLYDPSQSVARAYDAACTPDFFGFNSTLELRYRGRLDACGIKPFAPGTRRELVEAMRLISSTGQGPVEQFPSIGCSIKWRDQ